MTTKQREKSKQVRTATVESIKKFAEHAITQGNTVAKANKYYPIITKMIYQVLGYVQQNKVKLRDSLSTQELERLIEADTVIQKSIESQVSQNVEYHDLYIGLKNDLTNFVNSQIVEAR
jgi:hypothetical protein